MSNLMTPAAPQDVPPAAGVAAFPPAGTSYVINRIGARPLRFEGSELAMAMSYSAAVPYWYEINIYRTAQQGFVTAVRLFHQATDKENTVRAWENASIDDAIDKLTRYDAAYDLPVEMDFDAGSMPPVELAAKALEMQARISDARHHYKTLVGEFLHDLEQGE